jgi:sugar/nucleoside kinase (ribokinase family)
MGFIETEVDIVLANEAELASLFQTPDFEVGLQALSERVKIAAVTRGVSGSVLIAGGERHDIPAYPVHKVVDTTGAGDQYAAGFLLGLAQGRPLDLCGRLGSLAAAEVISHYGPRPQANLRDLAAKEGLI